MNTTQVRPDPPPLSLVARVRAFFDSLAGRLLALTVAAVVLGEALIFAPALAAFHESWLRDRINLAQIAALALEVSPEAEMADSLEYELLTNAEVQRVAMQRAGERELLLGDPSIPLAGPLHTFDYTSAGGARRFWWAVETFLSREGRVLRVMARPRFESESDALGRWPARPRPSTHRAWPRSPRRSARAPVPGGVSRSARPLHSP